MFAERMKTSAIPERVFALCQVLVSKDIAESDVKEKLEPSDLGGSTQYFGSVRDAARQLGLISIKDGNKIGLAVDKKNVSNMTEMRKWIVMHIQNVQSSLFYAVTNAYMQLNEKVYQYKSVSDAELISQIGKSIGKQVIEDDWYQSTENHVLYLTTPTKKTLWQVFSTYVVPEETYYLTSQFGSLETHQEFIDTILSRSLFNFNTSVDTNDKILTLSTCYNSVNRVVLHAKLIKSQNIE